MPKHEKKIPYIDPDNAMSPEQMEKLSSGGKPVIEMEAGRVMPLCIYSADFSFIQHPGKTSNLMMTIIHHVKDNKIEMRGRIRFDDTNNKQIFTAEVIPYSKEEYDKIVKQMKTTLAEFPMKLKYTQEPMFLEFEMGESTESVMHKMERSNRFNIGVMDNPNKK